MRLAILVAAFGLVATLPAVSPVFAPAAEAQAVSAQVEQNQFQARLSHWHKLARPIRSKTLLR